MLNCQSLAEAPLENKINYRILYQQQNSQPTTTCFSDSTTIFLCNFLLVVAHPIFYMAFSNYEYHTPLMGSQSIASYSAHLLPRVLFRET
jgi:hypothetical protein